MGCHIDRILTIHWSSLDLYACPEFRELRALIRNGEVDALALLDRDRLEAKGLQRLVFMAECREANIELVICQGPPIIDAPEGQLVEMALAIGKERSVLRARQGAKDGLRDRVMKRRLPVSRHRIYGYRWEHLENDGGQRMRLVPDENWETVKLIFELALGGASYLTIIRELKRQGRLSPQGKLEWNKAVISATLHNPTYAGRYYGLKKIAVEPKLRRGNTTGNSSTRRLSLEESHFMPEMEIVNPPITWEQRETILVQVATHKKLAKRNAKQDYLLRGLIECSEHTGQKGDPRKFHGSPKRDIHSYLCPEGGCERSYFNGPQLEDLVKAQVAIVLHSQPEELWAEALDPKAVDVTRKELTGEIVTLRRKLRDSLDRQVRLEERVLGGKTPEEVAERLREKMNAEQVWIREEEAAKSKQFAQLDRQEEAARVLLDLRKRIIMNLVLDDLNTEQWREVFSLLNVRIRPRTRTEMLTFFESLMLRTGTESVADRVEQYGMRSLWAELGQREPTTDPRIWLDAYDGRKLKELTMADVSIQMAVELGPVKVQSPDRVSSEALSGISKIMLAIPGSG